MEYSLLLDVETIDLRKRFIYDIGYIVIDQDFNIIEKKHFIIKQVYENPELFSTAYYSTKKKLYTSLMKGRTAKKSYLGHAFRNIRSIVKKYKIRNVYAFNSKFDEGAFDFTARFYEKENPLAMSRWIDLQAMANHYIHNTQEYKRFCIENNFITPKGFLQVNAEKTYGFITKNKDFKETHVGIQDVMIELEILKQCKNINIRHKKLWLRA